VNFGDEVFGGDNVDVEEDIIPDEPLPILENGPPMVVDGVNPNEPMMTQPFINPWSSFS
jgi:hypothetical protein